MPTAVKSDFWIAPDGSRLGCMRWEPDGSPRARVISLHGMSNSVEDIAPLGEALRERGILVEAWNLRGQGLDPVLSRRGAWLDIEGMLADLTSFTGGTPSGIPLFLSGESMGALLAIQAARREPWKKQLAGLLLFVPVVGLAQKNPTWLKALLRRVSILLPRVRLEPGWFVHGTGAPLQVSRIAERQHYAETSPHRIGPATLGFLTHMGDLIESSIASAPQIETPAAVFSAGHDVFVKPGQTREFFERIGCRDKTHYHYPESYHQLFFDLDVAEVLRDAITWIDGQILKVSLKT